MNINVKATNISLTPSISEYIDKKISVLQKFFENENVLINVEVGKTTQHHKSGDIFRAEVRLTYKGEEYYTVAETGDLYVSIDEVKDEIVRQISSSKNKSVSLIRRGGAKIKNLFKGFRK